MFRWLVFLGCMVLAVLPIAFSDEIPQFLILNSYHPGYVGSDALVQSAKQVLLDRYPKAAFFIEYMDSKRFHGAEYFEQYYRYFKVKYANAAFDAIISADDNAFQFMRQHHEELFPATPVVFCGINHFDPSMVLNQSSFTVILEELDIVPTLDLMLQLHPQAEQIVVVSDGSPTGLAQRQQVKNIQSRYSPVRFEYLNGEDWTISELLEQLQTLPDYSAVLALVWTRDRTNVFYPNDVAYPLISSNSTAPVYGLDRLFLGLGIVGGKLNWGGAQGEKAAQTVVRILEEKLVPNSIPVFTGSLDTWMFDYRQLQRFHIDTATLPEQSIVIDEPATFLRIDRTVFMVTVLFFLVCMVLLILLNISLYKRKQAEEAQYESEVKYRIFVENFHGIAYQMYQHTFTPLFFHGNVEHICGYREEDFMQGSVKWDRLIHTDDLQHFYFENEKLIDRSDYITNMEYRIRHKDGSYRWVNDVGQSVSDRTEDSHIIQGIVNDISVKKNLEEQLLQSQKLEAIGKLAGGVAHDFNNILTVILGYADLMLMEEGRDSPQGNRILQIQKAGQQAEALTRQLLAFSRKQVLQPQVVQVNQLLLGIQKMLRRMIGEDIELEFALESELNAVYCDPSQLEQVVMNLAVNARDAMPLGGKLTIETANVFLDSSYAQLHPSVTSGQYVMIGVSDTGHGIPLDVQERIFEPFFTTKERGKGTGLGLSTVHGIVKQSNGHIWVYSEPEQGTTFKVYFPTTDKDMEQESEQKSDRKDLQGNERILIVEDNRDVRKLVAGVLQKNGYTVFQAGSGPEAIEHCERVQYAIDLLVTDVVMPQMSGNELAKSLKNENSQIHVLFMSGYTDNAIEHHGVLDTNNAFLQKPVLPVHLLKKVREVLDA